MSDRRWLSWGARLAVGMLIAVVVGVGGLYVFIGTGPGLEFLAERIGRVLSDEATTVRVAGLEGSVTSSFSVGKITVADRDGVYAVVDDIRLVWRPLALFGRTLDIETLTIGRLAATRLPQTGPVSEPTSFKGLAPGFNITAGKVVIAEVALAPPVLGEAQRLSATASFRLEENLSNAALDLILQRVDGGRDKAKIKLDYATRPARFVARVRVEEPMGGVLARLAGLPHGERLSIDLSGDGPPDAWRGVLKLDAGTAVALNTAVAVALRDSSVSVSFDGTARIDSLLPAQLQPLLTPMVRFRTDADFVVSEGLSVRRLSAESDFLTLAGSGRYGIADSQISATIAVKSRDSRSPVQILPGLSIRQARVEAKLEGALEAPRISLSFQSDRIASGSMRMASTTGSFALIPVSATSFGLKGTAKVDGFDPGGAIPPGLLGPTLDLTVAGTVERDASVPRVAVTAASGPSKMELSGQIDRNGLGVGVYSLQLDQIETAARSAGLALKGNFRAEGKFRTDFPSPSIHVTTSGAFADLAGSSSEAVALLGDRLPFTGIIDWRDGGPLKVVGVKLSPAFGRLNVDGTLDINTGDLSARLDAAVPALKPLSTLAGMRLAGSATASAALEGKFSALTARGQALFTNLRVDETAAGSIGVGYAARVEGAVVTTALRIGGTLLNKNLDGRLNVRFKEGTVNLSDINISVGKNRVAGSFGVNSAHTRLTGAVKATLNDLGDLPGATQLGLTGSGEIRATMGSRGEPDVDLTAVARGIGIGSIATGRTTIEKATARLRLRDPLTRATAAGEVNVENVQVAGLQRGRAKISFSGNSSKIDWSTTVSADAGYPAMLSTGGTVSFAAARSRVSIKKLEGKIAEQAVSLRAPFDVTWRANEWQVSPVDLSLAGGRFRLAGSMTGGALDATGQFDGLPLRLASLIDPRFQMDGSVDGRLRASGAPRRPVLSTSLIARDIRPLDMEKEEFAGFNLTLDLRQDSDAAHATAKLVGPEETSATATVKTPPIVKFGPLSFTLEPDVPLAGDLTANGRLGLIDRLVGLGEDRVAGRIAARAKIAGTLGKPDIRGDVRLSGGSYEGAVTGSVLRNIEGHVRFAGDSARLVALTADDGAAGRLSGKGAVRFAGGTTSSDGVEITFDRFTALRHPLAEIVASGGVTLSGSLEAPRIAGRLRVDKGDVRIPDQLSEDIVELDVVEINGQTANAATSSMPKEPSLAKSFPVSLDLKLDFPRRTFVRGRGLDSEWKGTLVVSGTTNTPVIKGKLQAVRGTFAFAGRTFVLKSGTVFFPNSAVEPEIDAMAEAKLKDLLARVEISGIVSKPTIKISSDPALPQEDVLAHILFGRTAGQLSALQAAQLAQTAATLSGKGGAGIVDKVRQALGVDVLNVESEAGNGRGASLKAGKYLTEEIFLSVTQGTQPGSQKVGVEVQLLPNITVESDISGAADSNIGLNWKWDY